MTNQIPTGSPSAKLNSGKLNVPYNFTSSDLLQGFSDADKNQLQVVLVTAENGELSETNSTFTFTPDQNFSGNVSLDYIISDGNGAEINATQTFNIMAANQTPTGSAVAKLANGKINTPYALSNVNLLQGFNDANNDLLRVALISSDNGEIIDNANGTFTFTPDKDFTGVVTLDYVVSDDNGGEINASQTFNLVPDIPVTANQAPTGSASAKLVDGKKNTTYVLTDVNLLQGFSDANNDTLRIALISADNGEIIDNNNGTFTFTPDKDFSGDVIFDYVVTDSKDGEINASQKLSILSDDKPIVTTPVDLNPQQPTQPINSGATTLTQANPNFRGTANADNVEGSTIADSIFGQLGNDILKGNSGDDTLDGGNDDDQLFGGVDDDSLIGGDGNDLLNGGDDNDVLDGGNGDDTLDGGSGVDKMTGGNGDDVYFVENINDTVIENTSPLGGKDTVNSSITLAQLEAIEVINLLGENDINATGDNNANTLTGNIGNNKLLGNGGNDTLFGNEGNDTLDGGAGADSLNGGKGDDTYVIDNSADVIDDAGGKDSVQSSETISLVSYPTVENLDLTGNKAIKGTGNDKANIITGNSNNNELKGDKGNDTLLGGDGDDTLNGGSGENVLDGGNGEDTAIYNGEAANYYLSPTDNSVTNILTSETDQLTDVEFVQFNDKTLPVVSNDIQELSLSIADVKIKEGNKNGTVEATLVLTLDQAPTDSVDVEISTEDGTALSGKDYTAFNQTITFAPNQKTQKVKIKINSDTIAEDDETFVVTLANPSDGVTLNKTEVNVTILNDDKPSLTISNASITEGAVGKANVEVGVDTEFGVNTPLRAFA